MKKFLLITVITLSFCNLHSQDWAQVGLGVNKNIFCSAEYNGELYIGGDFTIAGGLVVTSIAKWNGTTYSTVGTNLNASVVKSMCVYNNELYIAGGFLTIGGISVPHNIAKWNGLTWSIVSSNPFIAWSGTYAEKNSLIVYNNKLILGGKIAGSRIVTWNGSILDTLPNSRTASDVFNLGIHNGALFAFGQLFDSNGTFNTSGMRFVKYNGTNWVDIQGATTGDITIGDIKSYNNELYITGSFTSMGGLAINNIAKWNGSVWSSVGNISPGFGYSMHVYNNELYVAGQYGIWFNLHTSTNGNLLMDVMKWNGTIWNDVSKNTSLQGASTLVTSYNNNIYAVGNELAPNSINGFAWLNPNQVGIKEYSINNPISISPNPSNGQFTFSGLSGENRIELSDITGRIIKSETITETNYLLDLNDKDKGVYLYKITNNAYKVQQGKLILQ